MDMASNIKHRVVALLYELAFLESRQRAGQKLSPPAQQRCEQLQNQLGGDPGWSRRRHRRLSVMASAMIKTGNRFSRAVVGNMSGGGALVVTTVDLQPGDRLLLKIGQGEAQYSFPCVVRRAERSGISSLLGLEFDGIPLEVRYGKRDPEPAAPQRATG
jgi:hypothetical protein